MKKLATTSILILNFIFVLLIPARSSESFFLSWPVQGKIGLKFGEKYFFNGEVRTHSGVDILSQEGAEIKSPIEGEVIFAGQVAGRQALTITFEGYKVSLSPLQEIYVSKGEKIERGQVVGKLSAEGDYSIAETHLHLSLRDPKGKYLDPLLFLPGLNEQPQVELENQPAESGSLPEPAVSNQPAEVPVLSRTFNTVEAVQPGSESQAESLSLPTAPEQQGMPEPHLTEKLLPDERRSLTSGKNGLAGSSISSGLSSLGLKAKKASVTSSQLTSSKRKVEPSSVSFNEQPEGLEELARFSKKEAPLTSNLAEGKARLCPVSFSALSWSFLVLPLLYSFLSFSQGRILNLSSNLREA